MLGGWLIIFLYIIRIGAIKEEVDIIASNKTYISQVLNRLTDRSKYDKRLRPKYGVGPVDVGVTIHVSSISAVSEVTMDFTLDFYLRQNWIDPRLAFGHLDTGFKKIESLSVGIEYLDRLWRPDTFFPNEKKSFFHIATTHNSFLRIDPDGRVSTSQRLTVTATCPMNLQLFPMDIQTCKLELESYGYGDKDIDYFWGVKRTDQQNDAVAFGDFTLPQFKRTGYRVNSTKAVTSTGAYARLSFEVILKRTIGFYLMNIIIPSTLIVIISWVSFWLNREASPARTNLGVITVLTMTALITTTNNNMPKVSYIKALDVFLNFCFVMVFASLVEFAIVSYLNKKLKEKDKKKKRTNAPEVFEIPMYSGGRAPDQNTLYRTPMGGIIPSDIDCRAIPLMQSIDGNFRPVSILKPQKSQNFFQRITPSKIDRCSRSCFPLIFVIFQIGYWSIMRSLSSYHENRVNYVSFKEEH